MKNLFLILLLTLPLCHSQPPKTAIPPDYDSLKAFEVLVKRLGGEVKGN